MYIAQQRATHQSIFLHRFSCYALLLQQQKKIFHIIFIKNFHGCAQSLITHHKEIRRNTEIKPDLHRVFHIFFHLLRTLTFCRSHKGFIKKIHCFRMLKITFRCKRFQICSYDQCCFCWYHFLVVASRTRAQHHDNQHYYHKTMILFHTTIDLLN